MVNVTFKPQIATLGSVHGLASGYAISNEPLLFSSSPDFAMLNGGPLTRYALNRLQPLLERPGFGSPNKYWVVDTKSVLLMPGQYPSIPGWHCDAVPRLTPDEQPAIESLAEEENTQHSTVFISDVEGLSRTKYWTVPMMFEVDPAHVWKSVHEGLQSQQPHTVEQKEGEIVQFNTHTLHCAQPAKQRGYRWWLRASQYYRPPMNQMRKTVQVYCTEGGGW